MTQALLEKAKTAIFDKGMTIEYWARSHGYPPMAVYRVLNGVDKARRGRAYEIAVKLGIKPSADSLAA